MKYTDGHYGLALFLIAVVALAISLCGQWDAADKNEELRKQLEAQRIELEQTQHDLEFAKGLLGDCIVYVQHDKEPEDTQ